MCSYRPDIGPWLFKAGFKAKRLEMIIARLNERLVGRRLVHTEFDSTDNRLVSPSFRTMSEPVHLSVRHGIIYLEIPIGLWISLPIEPITFNFGNKVYASELDINGDQISLKYPYVRGENASQLLYKHHAITCLGPIDNG